ncbi:alpha-amylase family glycosyl hydrolase [Methylocapsa sp. S129]|uniref:alpha-amylase family glycosyl hydrolase n=1 Tax=Methylocapsa sp. S129 TaxID=1641869 RepID=UPI00131E9C77|nr:alpha-amylase family glycosyl hydrolase [Methylocapsa sp. S129]
MTVSNVSSTPPSLWWRSGAIYQIYPRSFQDSDGDGVGDLEGIIARLDYVADLGVDAIWISPVFPSPMADFGYDVSDYVAIDPMFGSLATFDRVVSEAHRRGLKVILDYVPNHTSDRHPWFIESRSSRDNPKRDWYVWRDAKPDGAAPTNWVSEFGGGAWSWDAPTAQFYYHAFLREQPDLNWRNPEVVAAMHDVLRFWLARGVDGFRVDAVHHLIEDADLTDDPPNPLWREGMAPARRFLRLHSMDRPEVHDAIAGMRAVVDEYGGDRLLIGEAYLPLDRLVLYYGGDLKGFHLPFNFHLITTPWNPTAITALVDAYEAKLPHGAWPNWVLGNHDRSRLASRIGDDQARVAAMLLLTLRGTPTLYQGDEIGMGDVPIPADRIQDPWEKNVPGLGLGRDPVRTPMQWDASDNAGFSSAEPWLPLSRDFAEVNVAAQSAAPGSILSLYRALLALRRAEPALSLGDYAPLIATEEVLAYERRFGPRRLLIVLNLTGRPARIEAPHSRVLLSTGSRRLGEEIAGTMAIAPNEGFIAEFAP